MKVDLLGQTGQGESIAVSDQLTQNWYVHADQEGKNNLCLYPTPGLTAFATTNEGPVRGMIEYDDLLYVVSKDTLWEVNSSGTATNRGTLTTSSGRVSMAHNGSANGEQLMIVDGTNAYIWDSANTSFYRVDDITSGTATNGTANKLDVTGETFITKGAKVGQRVFNTTAGTSALITALDSETVLSIDTDIFSTATDDYAVGDPDFTYAPTQVVFMDGYFIIDDSTTTGKFNISGSYDGTLWDALDFATAERSGDPLQQIVVSNRVLWFLGAKTVEAWFNSGNPTFPFEPVQSGFSEWGTPTRWSAAEMAGSVFYLSQNAEGKGQVVMTNGLNPQVISTQNITQQINSLTTINDAYGYVYQHNGHSFYVLTFPTEGLTLVYDVTTQMWHTWSSKASDTDDRNGQHRSTHHVFIFNKHLVGDVSSGRILELDWDTYTDDGDTITRIRRSKSIHMEDQAVRHQALWVDMEEGVGDFVTTDPQIMMRFRDDSGLWSNEKWRSIGAVGEYGTRIVWRMLGRSRDRVYELKITDPVKAVIIAAYIDAKVSEGHIR